MGVWGYDPQCIEGKSNRKNMENDMETEIVSWLFKALNPKPLFKFP